MNTVKFREFEKSDIEQICILHKKLFTKDHFTAGFNKNLLNKYFLTLSENSDYALVAFLDSENKVLGYIFAGEKVNDGLKVFIKSNLIGLFFQLLKSPSFWIEKINDLISSLVSKDFQSEYKMRLFLIAADTDENVKGIGKLILEYFEKKLILDKKLTYGLSVRKENKKAIDFYFNRGMKLEFETSKSYYFYKKL